jgi:HD-GYP domain-containing protein (c-di-GMP phosphodiesterase class II)
VRFHHERFDGHGYPHGLAGEEIPLSARIIAIADTFDAMSSTRTYRTARDRGDVLGEMSRLGGTQFDPAMLAHFLRVDLTEYDAMNAAHGAGLNDPWRKAA